MALAWKSKIRNSHDLGHGNPKLDIFMALAWKSKF
jgi:hypothetical protein